MKFLIDANLPEQFALWTDENALHVNELGSSLTDSEIWNYACINDMVIVTKDADFFYFSETSVDPPRVIHLKIGNLRLHELESFLSKNRHAIKSVIEKKRIVLVYLNRIESRS